MLDRWFADFFLKAALFLINLQDSWKEVKSFLSQEEKLTIKIKKFDGKLFFDIRKVFFRGTFPIGKKEGVCLSVDVYEDVVDILTKLMEHPTCEKHHTHNFVTFIKDGDIFHIVKDETRNIELTYNQVKLVTEQLPELMKGLL